MKKIVLYRFRQDLRLADNLAFNPACDLAVQANAGSVALTFKKRVYTQLNFNTYAVRIFPASA